MTIVQNYRGKNILITGTTGFLGKVLLQKFLFSLPEIGVIYILIRRKKGLDLNQRFKKEVISSACFDRVRNKYDQKFDQYIQSKIKPIQGDLEKQNVGLNKKDHQMVINDCNIIINCAASIDFNQRLDGAIQSNIKGSLRMQALAKQVKNLDIFTHVSTCYVNCNLKGLIKQEIYPIQIDPEQQLKDLLNIPVKQLVANTTKILGKYPNTYTFTKALCERLMQKRRGDLPMCIIRPAIINTSYKEPFPGWLDSIAAAAAMFLFVGLGIIKQVRGNPNNIGDTIPVDVVVANIIVATAKNLRNNGLPIYHVGSSDRNPITWAKARDSVTQYWNSNPSINRVGKSQVIYSQNKKLIQFHQLKRRIPVLLYTKVSPFLGKQHQKNAQKMAKTFDRGTQIKRVFQFFVQNQWIYESHRVLGLNQFMNSTERKQFIVDAADIDIDYFLIVNNYGLQKYILKQNVELPSPQNYNLLKLKNQGTYFSDIKWAWNSKIDNLIKPSKTQEIRTKILSSTRILSTIDEQAMKNVQKKASSNFQEQKKLLSKQAQLIVNDLVGSIKMPVIRFLAWSLHKIFRKIYQKVNINSQMLNKIRQIQQNHNIPIVFMPTHKSYIDFLIVSYILFIYQQKLPYIVSDQALLNATLIPFLVRGSGAFFYKQKSYKNSKLYQMIFNKYVQILLKDGNNLQIFIQGTRSRTGKILKPQYQLLNIIFDTVANQKVNDVCIVPLTINYQKVLEGDTFPSQILGQQKVAQSLLRIIKAYPLLKVNFGRVYVEICDPISIKTYINGIGKKNLQDQKLRASAVRTLGKQIIYKMTQKLVILSTGIVSCVLLMNRKGITQDNLIKSVNWITKYILKKGYRIGGINQNSSAIAVRNAISHLQQIITKTKKNIFQLQISAGQDFHKILMLSYYRNTIIHTFLPEAFVSCSIAGFGAQLSSKQGVKLGRLFEETTFLMNLLNQQFLFPYNLQKKQTFDLCVQKMQQNSILTAKQNDKQMILINPKGDKLIALHFSLLRSLLQCYWATIIYLVSVLKNQQGVLQVGSSDKFFDMIQWQVQSMYQQKVIMHYEACSLQTIKNAIQTFSKMKFIKIKQSSTKKKQVRIQVLVKEDFLQSFGQKIIFFLKNSYQSSIISPLDIAKNTKSIELSKL